MPKQPTAILIATSTAVEPLSEKKTRPSPVGAIASSRAPPFRRLVREAREDHLVEDAGLPLMALR